MFRECSVPSLSLARFVCVLNAAATTGAASELVLREVGLRGEALPTAFTYDISSSSGLSRSGTDYLAVNFGAAVWGRYSLAMPGQPWGLVVGVDCAVADGRNRGADLMGAELRAVTGLGWSTTANSTFLAEIAYGYGYGRSQADAIGVTSSGAIKTISPQISLWWRCLERGQLTMTAGIRNLTGSFSGSDTEVTIKQSGLFIAIGVCWSASRAPWSLE